jgi:hypothetical protein
MAKTFHEFIAFRESNGSGTRTEVKLGKDNDFKPFIVDKSHYPNLRILVQAFATSPEIPIDNEIDSEGGGTKDITMKKKTLYLVGGAVRDHLTGKTAKDFDLVTDATPPQIRRVLKHAGFTEIKNPKGKRHPKGKDAELPDDVGAGMGKTNKVFWTGSWDSTGTDVQFHVRVNGDEFELATMRGNHKGENGDVHDKVAFGGIDQDADKRDFTINAMYIPLDDSDGPNARLIDMHGGVHHLKSGQVNPIGSFRDRLDEDPMRALRYIRFLARFSKDGKVPEDHKEAIEEIKDLSNVPPERMKGEFVHGLEHPDVDPKKYIKMYQELGILGKVFPNMEFELNVPEDFSDKKDRILAVAWILRKNEPIKVGNMLHAAKWDNREVNDIMYLISLYNWGTTGKFNSVFFTDMKSNLIKTSLVPSKIRSWGQMTGMDLAEINRFLSEQLPVQGTTIKHGDEKPAPSTGDDEGEEPEGTSSTFSGLAKRIQMDRNSGLEEPPQLEPHPSDDDDNEDETLGTEAVKVLWNKLLTGKPLSEDVGF